MNISLNAVPKPISKRNKPTAAQRGLINQSTRKKLLHRSQGLCERCHVGGVPLQASHTIRRWKIEGKTTINDLAHLCVPCHTWADNTGIGRQWLLQFRRNRMEVVTHDPTKCSIGQRNRILRISHTRM